MIAQQSDIKKSLSKPYRLVKPKRADIDRFKSNLINLLDIVDEKESEENVKIHLMDFMKNTWYSPDYHVATKDRTDLVIYTGKSPESPAGVLFEVKRPLNKSDMISRDNLNAKALHELVLYYMRERENGNDDIRRLVVTNIYEWFIFDANDFERLFYGNSEFLKNYQKWSSGQKVSTNTDHFYEEIASKHVSKINGTLPFTWFDIRDYDEYLRNDSKIDDNKLIPLFKVLSPVHQLKLTSRADSNDLDRGFYTELLHLIGLEEIKEGSNKLIKRKDEKTRNPGSLLENTINILDSEDHLHKLKNPADYGESNEDRLYGVALELCITWINRIIFLKLLEAQLVKYHGSDDFRFMSIHRVRGFDALNKLFFQVLAKKHGERSESVNKEYSNIPYMNSSLFEMSDLEKNIFAISSLDDGERIPLSRNSILKDTGNKAITEKELSFLEYLFLFLDSYDFSSEGGEEIQEESKSLINASVLGLIFEKINGYRDGSIYTPGFITMHICRETIRRAVVSRFNETRGWTCESIDDVRNYILDSRNSKDILSANDIINSLRVCDPAVGSGHFLVSALNEIITIKSELGILADSKGNRLTIGGSPVRVENDRDELVVSYNNGDDIFEYRISNGKADKESQRVQRAIFHEKQTVIENCLFGVDINANSVKICRLRLWIELLKNAYYTDESGFTELETLPNIDINIKEGNSLLSRFALNDDMSTVMKKSGVTVKEYKRKVNEYKDIHDKEAKRELRDVIDQIKNEYRETLLANTSLIKEKSSLEYKLVDMEDQGDIFAQGKAKKEKPGTAKLRKRLEEITEELAEIQSNERYHGAFEWRFEFPEVLGNDGEFSGFDAVVGNPPYIRQEELGELKQHLAKRFEVYAGTADILVYFIELGVKLLRPGGEFSFIVANKFMRAGFGTALRGFIKKRRINEIVDFGDLPVFDEVTTYPCILSITNREASERFSAAVIDTLDFDDFDAYLGKRRFEKKQENLKDEGWTLSNDKTDALLEKIRSAGVPLGEYVGGKIYYGIKTGLNEAFVIDGATRDTLIAEDTRSAEIIKPFLAGRDIKRYREPVSARYLIFTRRGIDIEKYPAIKKYLLKFKKNLEPGTKDGRKPGNYKWYEIQDTVDYYAEFEKPKIICPAIVQKGSYLIDGNGFYSNDKTTIIASSDKYLLANLNSRVADFILHSIASTKQGGFYEYKPMYIQQVPIFENPPKENEKEIKSLVDTILSLNKKRAKATDPKTIKDIDENISEVDDAIDACVYRLYGLTDKEIKMVEKG